MVRKRAVLKSPVREYRTPGTVRGPSGNRRSYLDYSRATKATPVCLVIPLDKRLNPNLNHKFVDGIIFG